MTDDPNLFYLFENGPQLAEDIARVRREYQQRPFEAPHSHGPDAVLVYLARPADPLAKGLRDLCLRVGDLFKTKEHKARWETGPDHPGHPPELIAFEKVLAGASFLRAAVRRWDRQNGE